MHRRKYIKVESGTVSVSNSNSTFNDVAGYPLYTIPNTDLNIDIDINGDTIDNFTYSLPSSIQNNLIIPFEITDSENNSVSWTYSNGNLVISDLPCVIPAEGPCYLMDEYGNYILDNEGNQIIVPCDDGGCYLVDNYGNYIVDNQGNKILVPCGSHIINSDNSFDIQLGENYDLLLPNTDISINVLNSDNDILETLDLSLPSSVDNGSQDIVVPDINITWDNSNHIYPSVKNLDLNSVVTDKHNIDFIYNGNIVDTQPNSITQYNLPNLCSDEWVRPSDWLPEPTITEDQAAYILYHVEQGKENIFTIYCTVSGTSPLNTYTIDYGDGNIINYNNSMTSVHILDYDNISNSNMIGTTKQVYIKIYPTTAGRNITNIIYGNATRQSTTAGKFRLTRQNAKEAFIKLPYSDWTFYNVYDYNNIERVKFIAIMPNKTNHSSCFGNMAELRQVDIIPNQFASATNFSNMFANCSKFNQDLNDWTNIAPIVTNMFSNCYAFKPSNIQDWNFSVTSMDGFLLATLIDIDTINLNTSGVTLFSNAIRNNSTSFRKVNDLSNFDFSSATQLVNFLYYIEYGQDTIHFNTTTALTNIQQVAYQGLGVKHIIFDECINVTNAANSFSSCVSLETLVLPNLQVTTNVSHTSMNATALNNLMTSLGTASGSSVLNITNNPGSATCNPTIATAKGWTVLI
jgi:hypothetical protein